MLSTQTITISQATLPIADTMTHVRNIEHVIMPTLPCFHILDGLLYFQSRLESGVAIFLPMTISEHIGPANIVTSSQRATRHHVLLALGGICVSTAVLTRCCNIGLVQDIRQLRTTSYLSECVG